MKLTPSEKQGKGELITLILRDGSRVHYFDGKLYISQSQLDEHHVVIRQDLEDGDYEFSGLGPVK